MKPKNVRLHRADGTVLNCELFHQGVDDEGMDCWVIANADYRPGDNVTMDELPGRTSVSFRAVVPPGTRRIVAQLKGRRAKKKRK
jgi:hypothetical protein